MMINFLISSYVKRDKSQILLEDNKNNPQDFYKRLLEQNKNLKDLSGLVIVIDPNILEERLLY